MDSAKETSDEYRLNRNIRREEKSTEKPLLGGRASLLNEEGRGWTTDRLAVAVSSSQNRMAGHARSNSIYLLHSNTIMTRRVEERGRTTAQENSALSH